MSTSTIEDKTTAKGSKTFKFELITPGEVLISFDVDRIVAKSVSGEFGILPKHADMTAQLDFAPIRYWYRGQEEFVAVMGGVLEIKDSKVTVISDYAKRGEDIDEAIAKKEADKAKSELDMLQGKDTNQKELVIAEHKLQRELMLLTTSQMRRNK